MAYYIHRKDPLGYTKDYVAILSNRELWFRKDTPPEIKERFLKDYAEHLERKRKKREQGIAFSDFW